MVNVPQRNSLEVLAIPMPTSDERPTSFADRLGTSYVFRCSDEFRKSQGLYLTPQAVADFMASLVESQAKTIRLLDPAAGAGTLICAVLEQLTANPVRPKKVEIVAYEIDPNLCRYLRLVLRHAKAWAADRGMSVIASIREQDFILANARILDENGQECFDVVIANPPYFKIRKDDPRIVAAGAIGRGQPNIYSLFMAVSAALLKPGGDLVSITPRGFASGPYFKRFRQRFFQMMRPVQTHIFESRREAFKRDDVLEENVILHAVRDSEWMARPARTSFIISTSGGIADLADRVEWTADLTDALRFHEPGSVFRLPKSPEAKSVLRLVDSWTGTLAAYGLDISTGPVVPFRAKNWLSDESNGFTVPLLWMNHVRAMEVHWPNGIQKPQYFVDHVASRHLLVPNRNYVVLRRFSAKEERRRLTAAPLLSDAMPGSLVGLENHLNYIHRPDGDITADEAWGLAALYNSALLDKYFRCISGSTQVGATELRAVPLPPLDSIIALGRHMRRHANPLSVIDELVMGIASGEYKITMQMG